MSARIGRDRLHSPAIIKGGGPERVTTEDPPDGWEPPPFLGFGTPPAEPPTAEKPVEPELTWVRFIGGRYDGCRAQLARTPDRLTVGSVTYVRVDDPDTGAFLGGYAHQED